MNFKRLLKPILVILAILILTLSVSAGDLFGTYDKRIKLTIDHTKIDADLSWFPVTVFLTSSQGAEVFTEFDADEDFDRIAFTTSDGETQLYADCELFDVSERKAIYHVSKTGWTVSSSTDTDIYLYYDNTAGHNTTYISKSGGTAAQSVWDSNFEAVYHMADGIDIGSPATNRSNHAGRTQTYINKDNPADKGGVIKKIVVWYNSTPIFDAIVATFYRPDPTNYPNHFTARDSYNIGKPTAGSKQIIDVDLVVEAGDYIGVYSGGGDYGNIEVDTSGGSDIWFLTGDYTDCTNEEFSVASGWAMSLGSFAYTIIDATSNANHGTKKGVNEPAEATGKVGQGQDFDGTDDDITLWEYNGGDTSFTFECIFNADSWGVNNYGRLLSARDGGGGAFDFYIDGNTGNECLQLVYYGDSDNGISTDADSIDLSTWYYITSVLNSVDNHVAYINGSSAGTNTTDNIGTDINACSIPIKIGNRTSDDNREFDGIIDEVRISSTARSAAWIAATYDSLWDTLLTYGAEETAPPASDTNVLFIFSNF